MFDTTEVQIVRAWATVMVARVGPQHSPGAAIEERQQRRAWRQRGERGEIAQTVIIVAILAAAAIAIATIIATKFRDKANSIPTE